MRVDASSLKSSDAIATPRESAVRDGRSTQAFEHNQHAQRRASDVSEPVNQNTGSERHAYHIMTKDGWKPLLPPIEIKIEVMRNPFRSHKDGGYANFEEWLRAN